MKNDNKQHAKVHIIVATHKPYWMPDDPIYLPLFVGAEQNKPEWNGARDNEGDNISAKNPYYCELTGLYWAWKNLEADYIGLAHYRRHFSDNRWWKKKTDRIITEAEIISLLQNTDVLLPKPRHYWIETNYSQYVHAHHTEDLSITREIIRESHPAYLPAYDRCMTERCGHRFNMFVMKTELLNEYCTWLFNILFELEKRLDISTYSKNDQRVYGFVGERLLDVWITTEKLQYQELSYVFLENQNWLTKGYNFLKRKHTGEKNKV